MFFALYAALSGRMAFAVAVVPTYLPPHSVSGFSSGGSLAVNHLIAFSSKVQGVGLVGGSPYGCNSLPDSGFTCSGFQTSNTAHLENKTIPWQDYLKICHQYLKAKEAAGKIDSVSNLRNKPVFLLSGTDDTWVYQPVMRAVADQFKNLSAKLKTEFTLPAAHSWVVDNITCKHPGEQQSKKSCCGRKNKSTSCPFPATKKLTWDGCCGVCSSGDGDSSPRVHISPGWRPPINSCNYDMAGELLRWILGEENVQPRSIAQRVVAANLLQVNQSNYLPQNTSLAQAQVDEIGFMYIPVKCRKMGFLLSKAHRTMANPNAIAQWWREWPCGVHVHYHPCGGSWHSVSTSYMLQNALPDYAETNDMVIVYPQTADQGGCWDWWGATGADFDTREGLQMGVVVNMIMGLPKMLATQKAAAQKAAAQKATTPKAVTQKVATPKAVTQKVATETASPSSES
jgi:hypothetical protein